MYFYYITTEFRLIDEEIRLDTNSTSLNREIEIEQHIFYNH